ncbi:MAG: LPP20 family lipoprotein [Cyclobacteriaceae bacterium]|nr:LPP20 family lipoprotein [Cyclobacteriaceae bacterium HetDA_MAG_MS6]
MKNSFVLSFLVLAIIALMTGCSKKLKQTDNKYKKIDAPFDASKYYSDKKHYRSTGQGKSLDLTVAKRIAETNARQAMASQIEVKVRSVGEQFLQNREISNKIETTSKYEDLTRTVIDETLTQVKIIGQQSFQNKKRKSGEYIHYVAMEMPTAAIASKMANKISVDESLKQDFDLEKFREIYLQELEDFENNR